MKRGPSLLLVTGTRADFGLWVPVVEALARAGFESGFLVTAMHLDDRFGRTVDEIRASGLTIAAEVECTAEGDAFVDMSAALGLAVERMSPVIESLRPDRLLVLGDRGEQLAAALVALHLGIRVSHLHGGERTLGAVDDTIRDLISRIATLHFVAMEDARRELIRLGIDDAAIHVTGAPGLDAIARRPRDHDEEIRAQYGAGGGPYVILAQHPETIGGADPVDQLTASLDAVTRTGLPVVAIYPNADAGGRQMSELLAGASAAGIRVHRSIPHDAYLGLLAGAAAIVGNSSSGLIEAPMLGVPVVNVGTRQQGRTRGDNVIDVPADADAIATALERALTPAFRRSLSGRSPYGDGSAAERIADHMAADLGGPGA